MNILVTGASGFLGRSLCHKLKEKSHRVTELSSSLCDLTKTDTLNFFSREYFDQIYHLAAWTQSGDFCLYHSGEQWLVNQKINTNILDWWQKHQPHAKLITIGTSCAYDPSLPLEEKYYLSGRPIESLSGFAMSKRMLLCGLQSLRKQYGFDYLFLIPATLYGTDELRHADCKQLHFIFDLVRKITRGKRYGEPVVLWGDGEQRRELIHVDDFSNVILRLSNSCSNEEINIGEGRDYSIRQLAQILCEQSGFPFSKIEFDTSRYVGVRSKLISTSKFKKALPEFFPRSLVDGLREMVKEALRID